MLIYTIKTSAETKEPPSVESFEDRNRVNASIKHLETIANDLEYLAKLVYQTARGARNMLKQIISHQRLSNYPPIQSILFKAYSQALDSPVDFSSSCKQASHEIQKIIKKLNKERKDYVEGLKMKFKKGIQDAE